MLVFKLEEIIVWGDFRRVVCCAGHGKQVTVNRRAKYKNSISGYCYPFKVFFGVLGIHVNVAITNPRITCVDWWIKLTRATSASGCLTFNRTIDRRIFRRIFQGEAGVSGPLAFMRPTYASRVTTRKQHLLHTKHANVREK